MPLQYSRSWYHFADPGSVNLGHVKPGEHYRQGRHNLFTYTQVVLQSYLDTRRIDDNSWRLRLQHMEKTVN